MNTGQLKAVWAFYKYYCLAPLLLSLLCCFMYYTTGVLFGIVMIKLLSGLGIRYFIVTLQGSRLFYYYNLHISRLLLWGGYFITDLLILSLALCTIHLIR